MGDATGQFGTTIRRAVLAVLFIAAGSAAWAGGGAEKSIDCVVYENGKISKTVQMHVSYSGGTTAITIPLPSAAYAVLRETKPGSSPVYRNPLSKTPDTVISAAKAQSLADSSVNANAYSLELSSGSVISASYATGTAPGSIDASLASKQGEATILWRSYGERAVYELSWTVGNNLYRLTAEAVPEFVPGEWKLFNLAQYASVPYERKALSLLATLFDAGEFESKVKPLLGTGSGASLFPLTVFDSPSGSEATDALSAAKDAVKGAIARHFLFDQGDKDDTAYEIKDEYDFPTIRMNETTFAELYGGVRNPYLMGYFTYVHVRGKPALSYPAQVRLWNDTSRGTPTAYDWKQYEGISATAGEKLAAAALRYMTSGVEYSLFTNTTVEEAPTATGQAHFLYERYKTGITSWITGGKNMNRAENYLPTGASFFKVLNAPTSAYENDFKTPFGDELGNPLPYAPYGIDTPRSFAYKMVEQLAARSALNEKAKKTDSIPLYRNNAAALNDKLKSTAIENSRTFGAKGYAELNEFAESDQNAVKPFLPGAYRLGRKASDNAGTSESDYTPDQTAGIDSVGLLAGALAMTPELDGVADALNRSIGRLTDAYSMLDSEASGNAVMADGSRSRPSQLAVLGLDAQGKPVFHTTNVTSRIKSTGATLTWSDLERTTTLVPDISLVRKGDLITGRDKEGRPHLGIVVGLGWNSSTKPDYGSDATLWYNKVYVVSVRRGLRVATVGTWGNSGTVFGGFTMNPEEYQIRRLVAFKTGTLATNPPAKETWEAFDEDVYGLSCKITFTKEADGWIPRWIPNTGEWLVLKKITISGTTVFGDKPLEGNKKKIALLAPLDAYADPLDTEPGSNVKNNRGDGIEIGGIAKGAKNYVWLAKARLQPDGTYENTVNTTYLLSSGAAKTGHTLEVNGEGDLYFNGSPIAVRPIEGGTIRPGDDFLLRFALAESPDVISTAGEADRIAIYDKKLLWRANLYIDEGATDWNNLHPWNAPASGTTGPSWWSPSWGYNEWFVSKANGADVDGGQIDIKSWSKWKGGTVAESGHVAYGWGDWDTVNEFNNGLINLATAITNLRAQNASYNLLQWVAGATTAPEGNWKNYVFPTRKNSNSDWGQYFNYRDAVTAGNAASQHEYHVDGLQVLIPGLSTFLAFSTDALNTPVLVNQAQNNNKKNFYYSHPTVSLGIDCSGLAHRAAKYNGSTYWVAASNEKYGSGTFLNGWTSPKTLDT